MPEVDIIDSFNEGQIPLLVAHPASVGHGLNLQEACNTVCWYGITWNLEHYIQFIDRVYRQGQKASTVVVHHIVCEDTKDDDVTKALEGRTARKPGLMTPSSRSVPDWAILPNRSTLPTGSTMATTTKEPRPQITLLEAITTLTEKHGSQAEASRQTGINKTYWSRLAAGIKEWPATRTLARLRASPEREL